MLAGWGFSPGSFGEVVFGTVDEGCFLVTLPIRWGTQARFASGEGRRVDVYPAYRKKAQKAAERACRHLQVPGGTLAIASMLPVGKGMASSSADIVAAMRAVAGAYDRHLPNSVIARLASTIEPSDGIMYPGIVAFNPLQGRLLERVGPVPAAVIIGLVGTGRVNTAAQYQKRLPYSHDQQDRLRTAVALARQGVQEGSLAALGQAGRISAEIQLERAPMDTQLAAIVAQAVQHQWGLVIAHTGTVRGFLFQRMAHPGELEQAERFLRGLRSGPVQRFYTLSAMVRWCGRMSTITAEGAFTPTIARLP